ncbi:MAG: DUF1080 domain-containing protein [Planctomycetia bacterium]|jgi:hypothetical protein|nr:DUF1080 domain-containing protein [Planctomycetia bacterium]
MRYLLASLFLLSFSFAADEPGFKPLFTKNLDGWKAKKGGESFDGKTEAYKGRFKLTDGVLAIDPKVKGDVIIETATEIAGDAVIRFEFKPGKGCNNDLFYRGQKFDIRLDDGKTKEAVGIKTGEWNTFEITAKGDDIEFIINGKSMRKAKSKVKASTFGIRAEFGEIEIRNLRLRGS